MKKIILSLFFIFLPPNFLLAVTIQEAEFVSIDGTVNGRQTPDFINGPIVTTITSMAVKILEKRRLPSGNYAFLVATPSDGNVWIYYHLRRHELLGLHRDNPDDRVEVDLTNLPHCPTPPVGNISPAITRLEGSVEQIRLNAATDYRPLLATLARFPQKNDPILTSKLSGNACRPKMEKLKTNLLAHLLAASGGNCAIVADQLEAMTIFGEARGQSVEEMAMISKVIDNRVRKNFMSYSKFVKDISKICKDNKKINVLLKNYQFSVWNNQCPNPNLLAMLHAQGHSSRTNAYQKAFNVIRAHKSGRVQIDPRDTANNSLNYVEKKFRRRALANGTRAWYTAKTPTVFQVTVPRELGGTGAPRVPEAHDYFVGR